MIYGVSNETQRAARHAALPRHRLAGHAATCAGALRYSIRHDNGCYRLASSCACGTVKRLWKRNYATFSEAWERLKRVAG